MSTPLVYRFGINIPSRRSSLALRSGWDLADLVRVQDFSRDSRPNIVLSCWVVTVGVSSMRGVVVGGINDGVISVCRVRLHVVW
jgi:hypothetical protein